MKKLALLFATSLGFLAGCGEAPPARKTAEAPSREKKADTPKEEAKPVPPAPAPPAPAPPAPAPPAPAATTTPPTAATPAATVPDKNPLLAELLADGIAVPGGAAIPLTKPAMLDGLDAEAQSRAIASVLPPRTTLKQFMDKSSSAPISLKVRTIPGKEVCRAVDLWFVAHGKWTTLTSNKFADRVFKTKKQSEEGKGVLVRAGFLTPAETRKRGLDAGEKARQKSRYFYTTFTLLDVVEVSVTRYAVLTQTPSSVVLAARVDGQFANDAEFPNYWRSIDRDAAAKLVYGKKNPYRGAGFYVKVTKLDKPADTIFVEYHSVFHEPKGWFDGENLLRARLPTIAQFQAKEFRGRLAKASEEDAGGK
jgi:hypothetical protein